MNFTNCQVEAVRPLIPEGLLAVDENLTVDLKSAEGLSERVWVLVTPDGSIPYQVVANQLDESGVKLAGFDLLTLRVAAVCVEVIATSTDVTREVASQVGLAVPSAHLFAAADKDFRYSEVYQPSGTPARAWLCLAVKKARS